MKEPIAFDVDGVLADFHRPFYKFILDNRDDLHFNLEDITAWDWSTQIKNLTSGEFWDLFDRFTVEHGYAFLPLISDVAFDLIDFLSEEGHPIYFITARPPETREETYHWIQCNFDVRYDNIIHTSNKSDMCNKLKISRFIEDTPHSAAEIADNSHTKVFLLDKLYNTTFKHPKIKRIKYHDEILSEEEKELFNIWLSARYGF